MSSMIKRNLKLYFRDKGAVFFSLLGVLIVVGLYFLFLGDTYNDSLKEFKNTEEMMAGWIVAGLLSITSLTTTMASFSTMILDKERKIFKDFYCAPVSRTSLTMGYIISSALIGLMMTMVTLVLTLIYLVSKSAINLNLFMTLQLVGLSVITSIANTAMALFVVTLVNSEKAFSAISGVTSALIGFITGIYIPVGNFPESVQYVVKCFPTSHCAVLFRNILMEDNLKTCADNFPKEAQGEALATLKETLGVVFKFGDYECTTAVSLIIIAGTIVLFSCLAVYNLNRKKAK